MIYQVGEVEMSCCPGSGNLVEMRHTCGRGVSRGTEETEGRGWKPLKGRSDRVGSTWRSVNSEGIYLNFMNAGNYFGCINDLCGSPASLRPLQVLEV